MLTDMRRARRRTDGRSVRRGVAWRRAAERASERRARSVISRRCIHARSAASGECGAAAPSVCVCVCGR